MKLTVNNEEVEIRSTRLLELLTELNIPTTGIAVAVSQKIVKREAWHAFELSDGMDIIIITAVCGG